VKLNQASVLRASKDYRQNGGSDGTIKS
jgi:hypothetical protein